MSCLHVSCLCESGKMDMGVQIIRNPANEETRNPEIEYSLCKIRRMNQRNNSIKTIAIQNKYIYIYLYRYIKKCMSMYSTPTVLFPMQPVLAIRCLGIEGCRSELAPILCTLGTRRNDSPEVRPRTERLRELITSSLGSWASCKSR